MVVCVRVCMRVQKEFECICVMSGWEKVVATGYQSFIIRRGWMERFLRS